MINQRDLTNKSYAIYYDLLKCLSLVTNCEIKSFYLSIRKLYEIGIINEVEMPEENSVSDIAKIEKNGQYIDITFNYITML